MRLDLSSSASLGSVVVVAPFVGRGDGKRLFGLTSVDAAATVIAVDSTAWMVGAGVVPSRHSTRSVLGKEQCSIYTSYPSLRGDAQQRP